QGIVSVVIRRTPISSLYPYTTLFRSRDLNEGEAWTAALGTKPADARAAQRWRQAGRVEAAYRDRYQVTDDTPLGPDAGSDAQKRSEEHTSELQSRENLVCRLLLEKKK